ncbi:ATP-binding protein [Enterobacter roggenkampii]|uniref:ATP-binding protein n=1 Tax=Enterobacter cloacae complex TaxID=354276 RepID=UPI001018823F|nr:ATP-binding protein [Enterobacter roggenkampii]EMB9077225.1 ATP-binding protein [Enterobacter cloacae]EKY3958291.1 ATP-binding protein [Enterobacter roggenkampii]MDH1653133.1 ATP-binding protein [Enterobacter roggenkampii]MDL0009407.1 ATP-binding protein [Enterobacter roggenkampii]MDV5318999.1 ATP-binding protein [Enterobacter roggenkampii]
MKKRYIDPFTPDLPIDSPDRFSGRRTQMDSVVDSLFQLSNNQPRHTIITGDRGIGKSSVLTQVKNISEGDMNLLNRLNIDPGVDKFDFICAWHDCSTDQNPSILASGILKQLENRFKSVFNGLKLELNIAGILKVGGKDSSVATISEISEKFCSDLTTVSNQAKDKGKSGVILFFDELDRVRPDSGVATFFKLSAEKLSRDKVKNIAFFAAGITGAIQNLEEEHASIYRTFKDVPLPKLQESEADEILKTGFNAVKCTYDAEVIKSVFRLSAGYPEPVHLLGSQLLKSDSDNHLDSNDFENAKNEVIETLRKNKLASSLQAAGSGKYQEILRAMAKFEGANVPLSYISNEIGYEQNQYSANMGNLVKRDIISQVDRGVYSFIDPLLKEYISRFGVIDTQDDV